MTTPPLSCPLGLKTFEAQIVQKLKNNEPRPKFIGSYEKSVYDMYSATFNPNKASRVDIKAAYNKAALSAILESGLKLICHVRYVSVFEKLRFQKNLCSNDNNYRRFQIYQLWLVFEKVLILVKYSTGDVEWMEGLTV